MKKLLTLVLLLVTTIVVSQNTFHTHFTLGGAHSKIFEPTEMSFGLRYMVTESVGGKIRWSNIMSDELTLHSKSLYGVYDLSHLYLADNIKILILAGAGIMEPDTFNYMEHFGVIKAIVGTDILFSLNKSIDLGINVEYIINDKPIIPMSLSIVVNLPKR